MWRSFFFAVGIFLFVAGLQCLVFEQFYIDQNNRVLTVAKRAGNAAKSSAQDGYRELSAQALAQPNSPGANPAGFSLPSSFYGGSSRFQSSGYGNQSFDNGLQTSFQTDTSPRQSLPQSNYQGAKRLKSHKVNDWVPWCLLAVGTIACLYTQSLGHSLHRND